MHKKCVAEAAGAFALCFVGILAITGASIAGAPDGTTNLTSIGLAHGLTIAVMVAALGAVSGAHFNPAVTLAFVVSGRMDVRTGAAYWASQLAGGAIAAGLLAVLFSTSIVAAGTPAVNPAVSGSAAVAIEAVATFLLVLVVFGTAVDKRAPASVFPLAIGLTVALDIMAVGPLTGAAMNPARVLGPALVSGQWDMHLVYWAGPLLGGAIAVLFYTLVVSARPKPAPAVEPVNGRAPLPEPATA